MTSDDELYLSALHELQRTDDTGAEEWANITPLVRDRMLMMQGLALRQQGQIERLCDLVAQQKDAVQQRDLSIRRLRETLADADLKADATFQRIERLTDLLAQIKPAPAPQDVMDAFFAKIDRDKASRLTSDAAVARQLNDLNAKLDDIQPGLVEEHERDALLQRQLSQLAEWGAIYQDALDELEAENIDPAAVDEALKQKVDRPSLEAVLDHAVRMIEEKQDAGEFDDAIAALQKEVEVVERGAKEVTDHIAVKSRRQDYSSELRSLAEQMKAAREKVGRRRPLQTEQLSSAASPGRGRLDVK